jgi:hypothetical protein
MKRILAVLAFFALAVIGSAQTVTVPAGSPTKSVYLSWTAPDGCVLATPCTFAVYRVPGTATISGGTTGATLVTTTASQAVAATDSTVVSGQTYSYAVETVQGGMNSVPSNTVTLSIPPTPGAPGLSGSIAP